MASVAEAVQRLTIDASTQGVVESREQVKQLTLAQSEYAQVAVRAVTATENMEKALVSFQETLEDTDKTMRKLSAANDNIGQSYKRLSDDSDDAGESFGQTALHTAKLIEHMKTLATVAYLVSPRLRSVVNEDVAKAFGLIAPKVETAAKAISTALAPAIGTDLYMAMELSMPAIKLFGSAAIAALTPVLAFLGPFLLAITAVTLAWKALSYVFTQGSGLLDKYANYNRTMFTPTGGEDALKEATKYQQDTISADQVQRATELGTRLQAANAQISHFFSTTLDTTNLSLRLQSVWVSMAEAIAGATSKMEEWVNKVPDWLVDLAKGIAYVNSLRTGVGGLPAGQDYPAKAAIPDPNADMNAARNRLTRGLNTARFGNDGLPTNADFNSRFFGIVKPEEKDANKTNEYDRALESINNQIDRLKLESEGAQKTSQAYQELKVAHDLNFAAMKAGIPVTDAMKEKWKALGDQISELMIKTRQAQALQNEQFKSSTMFMAPGDLAAANVAHQIDPSNWQAHMHDLAAETARFNSEIGQARDITLNFMQSFNNDIMNGTVSMNSLANAVRGLGSKLLDIAESQAINSLFGNLRGGGSGGGLLGMLFGGSGGGELPGFGTSSFVGPLKPSAAGNVFDAGRMIHPYALGGIFSDIVTRPTLFPMANGAGLMGEAGPEAIMPLRRGPDGRLGVSGAGGGQTVIFSPSYQIDARGSSMDESQFRAILAENNKQLKKDIDKALPSRVAAIQLDPRAR